MTKCPDGGRPCPTCGRWHNRLRTPTEQKLANAARRVRAATAERDRLIIRMHQEGASLREIAAHAGITFMGVQYVIRRDLVSDCQEDGR